MYDQTMRRMSSFQQERFNPKSTKYKNLHHLIPRLFILCLSTFYFGYSLTYLSSISLVSLYGTIANNASIQGFLIGIITIGAAIGAFISPFLMKCLSRRNFILVVNLCALIVQIIIQYQNIYCLFVCRFFQGVFIGNFMALVPVYINQLSPKQLIGSFGVFTQLFVIIGVVFSYLLGLILNKTGVPLNILWRVMFGTNIIFILIVTLSIIFRVIPESPNSLIQKNQNQMAKEVIGMYIKSEYVDEVYSQKLYQVQAQKNQDPNKMQRSRLSYSKKAYILGFQLPFMQQMTGVNAIVTQVGGIITQYNQDLGDYTPLIINVVQLFSTILTIGLLAKVGRRPVINLGNLGLAICNILIGVVFIFISSWSASITVIFGLLIIYMIIYGISLGPTVWLYVPEIIPAKIVPFATTLNWIGCSICIIITPILNDSFNADYPVFFLFGAISFIFFIINYFFMVETKGLSVQQICAQFKKQK